MHSVDEFKNESNKQGQGLPPVEELVRNLLLPHKFLKLFD